jgi:lipopolysaccharide biosynthesis regulator YciM
MALTKVEILQKSKDLETARKTAIQLQYELQKDQAEKRIAQIEAELAKVAPTA